jgi:3-hydroxyisobutyrate dehydrogenase-like beta-hydroxyacid dehydrogenase
MLISSLAFADDAAARAVLEGPEGVCAGISGKGYVDMSTLSVEAAIENAALVAKAGGTFVEAPVSGSKAPAEQGQLIFLAAGMHR